VSATKSRRRRAGTRRRRKGYRAAAGPAERERERARARERATSVEYRNTSKVYVCARHVHGCAWVLGGLHVGGKTAEWRKPNVLLEYKAAVVAATSKTLSRRHSQALTS
jgi:hypothetical protein